MFQIPFLFRNAVAAGHFQHLDVWNQQQLSIKKDIHFIHCPYSNWSIVRRNLTTTVAKGEAAYSRGRNVFLKILCPVTRFLRPVKVMQTN